MKAATVAQIKKELNHQSQSELIELKTEIDDQFELINTSSYFYIKKSVRKILRMVKKYIRYSKQKETEVELLLHFCRTLNVEH